VLPRCASSLALNLNLRVKVIAFPITQKYALEASQSNTDTIFNEINILQFMDFYKELMPNSDLLFIKIN
jgi:hypothetical protein